MHATHSTLAENASAQPTSPATAGRPVGCRRLRHAASLAAIVLALTFILGLAATGCDADRSVAASDRGSNKDNAFGIAALTVDDLPATLNLSTEQRSQLTAALAELRQNRQRAGHRFGAAGRNRGDNGGRGQGMRAPGVRRHRADGTGRDAGRGFGPGAGAGPAAGFEPPMIGFLESASSILNGDQFVILAQFLAGRRTEMGPGPGSPAGPGGRAVPFDGPFGHFAARRLGLNETQQSQLKPLFTAFGEGMLQVRNGIQAGTMTPEQARDRAKELRLALEGGAQRILTADQWQQVQTFRGTRQGRQSERRADAQPQRVDRITGMYIRVLGLGDAQASQVRQIMEATIPARRSAAEQRAQGTLAPEDCAYEMMTIEKRAAEQVRGVLTPDQTVRFDALRDLLPPGLHMGGLMGGSMGGPAGGPRGRPMGPHRGRR